MSTTVSYSEARARLAELWDEASSSREAIIMKRRGKEDMALIAADELASMEATLHLLRSPANAERLLTSLANIRAGKHVEALTVDDLRERFGLYEVVATDNE